MKNVKKGHSCPVVCLDAGHYGKQNRSSAVPEFYESQINWKLHNLLADRLTANGIRVVKTRKDVGKDLELTLRGKMAKDCDLFISIHVNAADNTAANYVLGVHMVDDDCGVMDEQSKDAAMLLSSCVAEIMGVKAECWTRKSSSDRDGNGHKDDYYGVLRGAHSVGTAGVILEHGFYTNKAQAMFLMDEKNLMKLADAEAKAIVQWFGVEEPVLVGNPYMLELIRLRKGIRGEQVKALQALLVAKGYSVGDSGVDGSFGPMTEKSVRKFQQDFDLDVDGVVGPQTMRSLLGYR